MFSLNLVSLHVAWVSFNLALHFLKLTSVGSKLMRFYYIKKNLLQQHRHNLISARIFTLQVTETQPNWLGQMECLAQVSEKSQGRYGFKGGFKVEVLNRQLGHFSHFLQNGFILKHPVSLCFPSGFQWLWGD